MKITLLELTPFGAWLFIGAGLAVLIFLIWLIRKL